MTVLLEMRERLKLIYAKGELFILPLAKFLLAFITFNTLNGRMGYMVQMDNVAIVLIGALTCSFLPCGAIVFFSAVFSLMHMYALSMEAALVGLCVYLVMYLLFYRFCPKDSLVVVLTPLLCTLGVPYVVPLVVGLLCGPMSVVSVSCGVIVYYLFQTVSGSAQNLKLMGDDEVMAKVHMIIENFLGNKAMLVMIAAFAITVLVVYLIRRMSINYSWTIAMVAGAMINLVMLLVGDFLYDVNFSVGGALLGSLLAVAVAKIVEFFRFCVDYHRTEKVQFEDDEYYYYVKAIPKMSVSMSTKTVKRITSQQARGTVAGGRQGASQQPARSELGKSVAMERTPSGRSTGAERAVSGRSVITERTPSGRSTGAERAASGRSVAMERTPSGRSTGAERAVSGRSVAAERTSSGRNAGVERMASGRNAAAERSQQGRNAGSARTSYGRGTVQDRNVSGVRTSVRPQGRSNVTIGRTVRQDTVENVTEQGADDYEELF